MIHFPNNVQLVQAVSELPNLIGCSEIVLDFETTSGNPKVDSLNPWFDCDVAGVCICDGTDLQSPGYYIPIGHSRQTPQERNLDKKPVARWLFDVLQKCDTLVGHNLKYDAHVLKNCLDVDFNGTLYDTLTQAKIIDSDRLSYGLDSLSRDWLKNDISGYEEAFRAYLYDGNGNRFNKDYGEIPIAIMAPYGGQDVITTRELKRFIQAKLPEPCSLVSQNEIKLTTRLLELERHGMCINPTQVEFKKLETMWRLQEIFLRIRELTGSEIRPNTTEDCFRFLCGQYGLPVLAWTNEDDEDKVSNPSFNKDAMRSYLIHPKVQSDPTLKECVELIQEYRTKDTFNSLFLNTFIKRNLQGVLHPSYNQMVRTARLSCSDPNAQQMSSLAKELIVVPDDDWVVVDIDLSQIEFRLIASTLNNQEIINRYNANPRTDYHQLVADMAGLERKPAKNLNFAVGFAAGKSKAIEMVKGSLDISSTGYKESGLPFDEYCEIRAKSMYAEYHQMLPELKTTIKKSENIAKQFGYISNLYGRWRRLPRKGCYKAFNNYVQSSAADLAKHITLEICNYIDTVGGIKLIGVVHDSWIFYMHKSSFRLHCKKIGEIIEKIEPPGIIRVPILCDVEVSDKNWGACKSIAEYKG